MPKRGGRGKSSTLPDAVFLNRPDYTCDTCRRWVFRSRKGGKHWLRDREDRVSRVAPHACGGGFVVNTPATPGTPGVHNGDVTTTAAALTRQAAPVVRS